MKTTINALAITENWKEHKHTLQHFFTWLTGYEIMFEGSRKDLIGEIPKKIN